MFIVGLYTIAIIWIQPRCPAIDKCIKNMWYIYIYTHKGILLGHRRERNLAIWDNMDGPIGYYV